MTIADICQIWSRWLLFVNIKCRPNSDKVIAVDWLRCAAKANRCSLLTCNDDYYAKNPDYVCGNDGRTYQSPATWNWLRARKSEFPFVRSSLIQSETKNKHEQSDGLRDSSLVPFSFAGEAPSWLTLERAWKSLPTISARNRAPSRKSLTSQSVDLMAMSTGMSDIS